ncbi:hypothetical protein N0V88_001928 [Collariella sp. IMI 366227]|nr:hypothetical protein N0V88_001928 [Collariella sp. IMI 366227]
MAEPAHPSDSRPGRERTRSNASSVLRRLSQDFIDSRPAEGFMAVTGDVASSIFSARTRARATGGKKVKRIEGVPLTERDRQRLEKDRELGIPHYNNIKDKKPKEKKGRDNSEKYGNRDMD